MAFAVDTSNKDHFFKSTNETGFHYGWHGVNPSANQLSQRLDTDKVYQDAMIGATVCAIIGGIGGSPLGPGAVGTAALGFGVGFCIGAAIGHVKREAQLKNK